MRARVHGVSETKKLARLAGPELMATAARTAGGPAAKTGPAAASFGYMFPDLASNPADQLPKSAATVTALRALGKAMALDPSDVDGPIPAAYTYFGQFIDHDITKTAFDVSLNMDDRLRSADPAPLTPQEVQTAMENERSPQLDLESLYAGQLANAQFMAGELPAFAADGKFRVGKATPVTAGLGPIVTATLEHDVPRRALDAGNDVRDRQALIGDPRNDENLLVAQMHLAFMRSHNAIIDRAGSGLVNTQREILRRYQWAVLHDFLPRICDPAVVADVLANGAKFFDLGAQSPFMPLEFSAAAFRFGHSMVRQQYEHNATFNSGPGALAPATFNFLFTFTALSGDIAPGGGSSSEFPTLPNNWPIEWHRFFGPSSNPSSDNPARRIDTRLALELGKLRNGDGNVEPDIMAQLATRNLLRGYLLGLPTGQAVARKIGVPVLAPDKLESTLPAGLSATDRAAIDAAGLMARTPLWYYVLAEAQLVSAADPSKNHLGAVGSRIVAETLWSLAKLVPGNVIDNPPTSAELATKEFTLRGLIKLGQDSAMPPIPDVDDPLIG